MNPRSDCSASLPPPVRILDVFLPLHRTPVDFLLDSASLLLSKTLTLTQKRTALPRRQLEALGITPPPDFEQHLMMNAGREFLRILFGRWTRLDLSPLSGLDLTEWKQNHPTLFLSMHHGQWEWLAALLTQLRPGAKCVARGASHPAGQRLLDFARGSLSLEMLYDRAALRSGRRQLAANGLLAFLADQRPPGTSRPGTWFGLKVPVTTLPAWWSEDIENLQIWTGVLRPGRHGYQLNLKAWPRDVLPYWDHLLSSEFSPLLATAPHEHFGLWHNRLGPTRTRRKSRQV